jgi:hypothetical protein
MAETSTNPKDKIGLKKAPLRLVPPALVIETAPAMANGAKKYGPYNWRETTVSMSVYLEAILRHTLALMDGEDFAEDSGCHHMSHIAANAAIFFDARALGRVIDDRPVKGPAPELLEKQNVRTSTGSAPVDATGNVSAAEIAGVGDESRLVQRILQSAIAGCVSATTAGDRQSETCSVTGGPGRS